MSLKVWLPLNGNLNNQGCSDLTFSLLTSNTSVNTSGKIGSCYGNNSNTAGGLVSNKTINLGTNQSMFCWFKFTSLMSDSSLGGGLVNQHRYATNSGMGINIKYVSSTTGYITVNTGNGSGRTYNTYCGTTLLQANTWYHGGYTYNGSTLKIYLNGICENTVSISNMSVPTDYLTVFCWSMNGSNGTTVHNNYKLNGFINDVRIYDHCLSPKEVKEISKALVIHYPLDGNGKGNDNILPGTSNDEWTFTYPSSSYSDKWASTTSVVPSASQYILSFWAKSTVNGDKVRAHYYSPNTTTRCESNQGVVTTNSDGNIDITLSTEWKKYWIIYTQSSTTAVKRVIFPRMWSGYGSGTVSIKMIKFEEGTIPTSWCPNSNDALYTTLGYNSTTEYDTSGFGNNGTKTKAMNASSNTAKYSSSIIFDGSNDCILTPFNAAIGSSPTAFTINTWIYKTSIGTKNWQTIFGGPSGFELEARKSNESNPVVVIYNWGQGQSAYEFNKWTMVTMIWTTSDVKLYINGELKVTGNTASIPSGNYYVGSWRDTTSQNFEGQMSDFRIYATALSADDVKELYQTSASISDNGTMFGYDFNEE